MKCELCDAIPKLFAKLVVYPETLAEALPAGAGSLEDFSELNNFTTVKRCPSCRALFLYSRKYEFLFTASEEEIELTRLEGREEQLEALRSHAPRPEHAKAYAAALAALQTP